MSQLTTEKQYKNWIAEIKSKIQHSQYSAIRTVNQEMIIMYWKIGKFILEKFPEKLQANLPTIEKLEEELASPNEEDSNSNENN